MSDTLKDEIIEIYDNIGLLNNNYCLDCNPKIKNPLLPWHIGDSFFDNEFRILFVGKPHRGTPGKIIKNKYLDPDGISEELFFEKNKWAFWAYTREISKRIFGSEKEGWNNISITNLVKCTNTNGKGSSTDKTTLNMAQNCIDDNSVIFKEIRILKPKTIIFYTWSMFRKLLKNFPKDFTLISEEKTINNREVCGKKKIGWWERTYHVPWSEELRVLIISHPERKKKIEYINKVSNWIKQSDR
jgi:hypothetical protein